MLIKQGHTLINWVEGVSDEAYKPCESPKKNSTKVSQPYICQLTNVGLTDFILIFSLHEVRKALTLTFFYGVLRPLLRQKYSYIGEFDRGAILNKKPVHFAQAYDLKYFKSC